MKNLVEPIKSKKDIEKIESYLAKHSLRNRLIFVFSFTKELKWGLAYLITISQLTIAGFIIKSAIAQNEFSDSHLYLASIPILAACFLFVVLIALYKIIEVKDSTASLYVQGDKLYENKRYNEALKCYDQAYNIDNSTADYYYYAKGMVHYAQKDYEKTLSCLNDALPIITSNVKKEYLTLIEKIQKEHEDLIEKAKQEAIEKVNRLYNESLNCKWSKNYIQALNHITEALKIAKQEKLDTSEIIKLKDELTAILLSRDLITFASSSRFKFVVITCVAMFWFPFVYSVSVSVYMIHHKINSVK